MATSLILLWFAVVITHALTRNHYEMNPLKVALPYETVKVITTRERGIEKLKDEFIVNTTFFQRSDEEEMFIAEKEKYKSVVRIADRLYEKGLFTVYSRKDIDRNSGRPVTYYKVEIDIVNPVINEEKYFR